VFDRKGTGQKMEIIYVSLFVLSIIGSLWTTAFAYFEYRLERDDEYTQFIRDVILHDVYSQCIKPNQLRNLQTYMGVKENHWPYSYTELLEQCVLSEIEYKNFIDIVMENIGRRRTFFTYNQRLKRVKDIAPTYILHTDVIDKLIEICIT